MSSSSRTPTPSSSVSGSRGPIRALRSAPCIRPRSTTCSRTCRTRPRSMHRNCRHGRCASAGRWWRYGRRSWLPAYPARAACRRGRSFMARPRSCAWSPSAWGCSTPHVRTSAASGSRCFLMHCARSTRHHRHRPCLRGGCGATRAPSNGDCAREHAVRSNGLDTDAWRWPTGRAPGDQTGRQAP